jgi:hypothetical protein
MKPLFSKGLKGRLIMKNSFFDLTVFRDGIKYTVNIGKNNGNDKNSHSKSFDKPRSQESG